MRRRIMQIFVASLATAAACICMLPAIASAHEVTNAWLSCTKVTFNYEDFPDTSGPIQIQLSTGQTIIVQTTGPSGYVDQTLPTLNISQAEPISAEISWTADGGGEVYVGPTSQDCQPPCPTGYTGTSPNCQPPQCPTGDTGTYPNCVQPQCPSGDTGIYPICVKPPIKCPLGEKKEGSHCLPSFKCPGGQDKTKAGCVPPVCMPHPSYHVSATLGPQGLAHGDAILRAHGPSKVKEIIFTIFRSQGRSGYAGNFTKTFHTNNVVQKFNVANAMFWGLDHLGYTYNLHVHWKVTFKTACGSKVVTGVYRNDDPLPVGVHL